MANLLAVLTHGQRGGQLVAEATSHVLNSEGGGASALAGAICHGLRGERGAMDLGQLEEILASRALTEGPAPALVWLETTHNAAGGAALPVNHMAAVRTIADAHGARVHIDGARLFNAAVALGVDAKALSRYGDSVCFCISKGLSAPVGSLLCGSHDFIRRARSLRRMVGGNLRQAGPLAAAGVIALQQMVTRLADDHRRAQQLALALHALDASIADPAQVETNLVRASTRASGRPAAEWSQRLQALGVLVSPCAKWDLRFVTHRHIGDDEVKRAGEAFADVWRRA
jgi:threonine aldolase